MILNAKRTWLLSGALTFAGSACALADSPGKKESSPTTPATTSATTSGLAPIHPFDPTTASGWKRPEKGYGLFVTGELLWWHAYQGGMDYAITSKTPQSGGSPDTPINGSVKKIGFDFEFGVRLGLGYIVPSKVWDIYFSWTDLCTRESSSAQPPTGGSLYSTRELIFSGVPVTKASARWKISLNQLNLELGRAFTLNPFLAMRPHIGFVGALINQHIRFDNNPVASGVVATTKGNAKNDFAGWGLRGGLDTRWLFAKQWSIYGNLAAAAVWGKFNLVQQAHTDFDPRTGLPFTTRMHNHLNRAVALLQLALGLRWDGYFHENRWHLGFHLGYEFNEWFDQNQLRARDDGFDIGTAQQLRNPGDLGLQGITAGARLDF